MMHKMFDEDNNDDDDFKTYDEAVNLENLPAETIGDILSYCDYPEHIALGRVSYSLLEKASLVFNIDRQWPMHIFATDLATYVTLGSRIYASLAVTNPESLLDSAWGADIYESTNYDHQLKLIANIPLGIQQIKTSLRYAIIQSATHEYLLKIKSEKNTIGSVQDALFNNSVIPNRTNNSYFSLNRDENTLCYHSAALSIDETELDACQEDAYVIDTSDMGYIHHIQTNFSNGCLIIAETGIYFWKADEKYNAEHGIKEINFNGKISDIQNSVLDQGTAYILANNKIYSTSIYFDASDHEIQKEFQLLDINVKLAAETFQNIACSKRFTVVLTYNQTENTSYIYMKGLLGLRYSAEAFSFVAKHPGRITEIVAGDDHIICVTNDNQLFSMGSNHYKQLIQAEDRLYLDLTKITFDADAVKKEINTHLKTRTYGLFSPAPVDISKVTSNMTTEENLPAQRKRRFTV